MTCINCKCSPSIDTLFLQVFYQEWWCSACFYKVAKRTAERRRIQEKLVNDR